MFEKPGKQNTDEALTIAKENADKLGIKDIIVASTGEFTAEHTVKMFNPDEYNLIIITHNYGFRTEVDQEFDQELRKDCKSKELLYSRVPMCILELVLHFKMNGDLCLFQEFLQKHYAKSSPME